MKSMLAPLLAVLVASCVVNAEPEGQENRFPVPSDYPEGTMLETSFTAGVPEAWRLTALTTPDRPDATWKVVIITGTPSWNAYWAPTLAALPESREMVVANRPGFRDSEPHDAVRDIAKQADALAPMLEPNHPGQRVVLVGQSFGAPVATLMASRYAEKVDALVLVSSYFGERGPTARRLFGVGRVVQGVLPRDLRNSITEVRAQPAQLPGVWSAFEALDLPIVFVHGDQDTFVTIQSARNAASRHDNTLIEVAGGDHFLNACCVPALLQAVEQAIGEAEGREAQGQDLVGVAAD